LKLGLNIDSVRTPSIIRVEGGAPSTSMVYRGWSLLAPEKSEAATFANRPKAGVQRQLPAFFVIRISPGGACGVELHPCSVFPFGFGKRSKLSSTV